MTSSTISSKLPSIPDFVPASPVCAKETPEILRLEVALQDFAEFAIVIHYEQIAA